MVSLKNPLMDIFNFTPVFSRTHSIAQNVSCPDNVNFSGFLGSPLFKTKEFSDPPEIYRYLESLELTPKKESLE